MDISETGLVKIACVDGIGGNVAWKESKPSPQISKLMFIQVR